MTHCELVTMSVEFCPYETYFFALLKYVATSSSMPIWQLNVDETATETGLSHLSKLCGFILDNGNILFL